LKKNIAHEIESVEVPDICGKAIELINRENSDCKNMSIATILVDKGESSRLHYHKQMEELYYIVEGEAEMNIDNQKEKVIPGHAILIPVGVFHQIKNIGSTVLKFISIDSPPFFESDIFFE